LSKDARDELRNWITKEKGSGGFCNGFINYSITDRLLYTKQEMGFDNGERLTMDRMLLFFTRFIDLFYNKDDYFTL